MAMKNWVVPVTIWGDYLSMRLYYADYPTAESAKRAAQSAMDGLATYVKPPRPFIVGEPEELT